MKFCYNTHTGYSSQVPPHTDSTARLYLKFIK
nr:MAG TPA: hypothetical protein [Caudoviricetes sp.]